MGLGSIVKTITGSGGADAAKKAGRVSAKSKKQALAELEKIPGLLAPITEAYQEAYDPYAALGTEYLPQMQAAASPAGYSARLDEIMNTSTFAPLLAKRMEAGQTQMANLGLSRSGAALREATAIPTELAMQMEEQLYGRMQPLFNTGIAATEARLAGTTDVQQQLAQMPIMRGNVMMGIGQDQSQAILGAAQAKGAGVGNLLNLGMQGLGMYGASQGWFK